jgi:hypothetical protein
MGQTQEKQHNRQQKESVFDRHPAMAVIVAAVRMLMVTFVVIVMMMIVVMFVFLPLPDDGAGLFPQVNAAVQRHGQDGDASNEDRNVKLRGQDDHQFAGDVHENRDNPERGTSGH